jgi:hypothetical protein
MKRILLFLILSLSIISVNAQQQLFNIDTLINKCEDMASAINSQILYKIPVSYGRLGWGYDSTYDQELSAILYFDKNGAIRRSECIYDAEISGIGRYVRYYDNNGDIITSIVNCDFGPDGVYSAVRYISGNIVHLDFVVRHNENQELILERTIKTGGRHMSMPVMNGNAFDRVLSIEDLRDENKLLFNVDDLHMPDTTLAVTFMKPSEGDTTYIIRNNVPIYKRPGGMPIKYVDICDVTILNITGEWCKIRTLEFGFEGYVSSEYLAPVEQPLTN